jgi:3-ketoacyl-CoA synthase
MIAVSDTYSALGLSCGALGVLIAAAAAAASSFPAFSEVLAAGQAAISAMDGVRRVQALVMFVLVALGYWRLSRARRPVYLVDFEVFSPPERMRVTSEKFMRKSRATGRFSDESLAFQEKLLSRTGLGENTYFPDNLFEEPPRTGIDEARAEAEEVLGTVFAGLLAKTGLKPRDVDILIINCSLFNPTPSLASMIVNKFKLRESVLSFNLSGQGCSAGLISIDLAADLLQVHRGANAVVLSTENITQNWYLGDNRSMLVSNTLFRVGGAAILLTSSRAARWRAKYAMKASVRVHAAQDDQAYRAVFQCDDGAGRVGVALSKELLTSVGGALKANMTRLGPQVLPYSEQLKFFASYCYRRWIQPKHKQYVPDFSKAFEHYCIHAGGRAIIDGLQQNLKLSDRDVEPSRATLYRYGNTSSSSVWYELNYIEKAGRLRSGDRVWQIAVGSGIKCNSVVWQSLKTMRRVSGGEDEEE